MILTTLAGQHYTGSPSTIEVLDQVLGGVAVQIQQHDQANHRLVVRNPTNLEEDFSESWNGREVYRAFREYIQEFRSDVKRLQNTVGLDATGALLDQMFGDGLGSRL